MTMSRDIGFSTRSLRGPIIFYEAPQDSEWFIAIQTRGECAEVMRLLKKEPGLLRQTGLYGRTALHKAVIEGCAQLVVEVLLLVLTAKITVDLTLGELLQAVDSSCDQTALVIATVIGNRDIINRLNDATKLWQDNTPSELGGSGNDSDVATIPDNDSEWATTEDQVRDWQDKQLPKLQEEFLTVFEHFSGDGNNGEEFYVLHWACAKNTCQSQEIIRRIVAMAREELHSDLIRCLYKLQDHRGMTPLHVAATNDTSGNLSLLLELIPEEEFEDCVNARDGAGRTPLHRVAARSGDKFDMLGVLVKDGRTDLNAGFSPLGGEGYSWQYSRAYCSSRTALHLAVVHNNPLCVKELLGAGSRIDLNCVSARIVHFGESIHLENWTPDPHVAHDDVVHWTPLQIAAIMGHQSILKMLVKDDRAYDQGRLHNKSRQPDDPFWHYSSVLLIVARIGNPEGLRIILESRKFNPFCLDYKGTTALHRAADALVSFHHKVQYYGDFVDYESLRLRWEKTKPIEKRRVGRNTVGRKRCIILLLQAADMDLWPKDEEGNDPHPGPSASEEVCNMVV